MLPFQDAESGQAEDATVRRYASGQAFQLGALVRHRMTLIRAFIDSDNIGTQYGTKTWQMTRIKLGGIFWRRLPSHTLRQRMFRESVP